MLKDGFKLINLQPSPSGGADDINLENNTSRYFLVGNVTLSASWDFTVGNGTPRQGDLLHFIKPGAVTLNGNNFGFFGVNLTPQEALSPTEAICFYDGSNWQVYLSRRMSQITSSEIPANAITLDKLQQSTTPLSLLGRSVNTNGNYGEISAASANTVLKRNSSNQLAFEKLIEDDFAFQTNFIRTDIIVIPSAALLTSNATPVQLLSAPGVDRVIMPLNIYGVLRVPGTAYTGNVDVEVYHLSSNTALFEQDNMLAATTGRGFNFEKISPSNAADEQIRSNQPLMFRTKTNNPSTGNRDLAVAISYIIIDQS